MENHWIMSEHPQYESDKINAKLKFAYWEGHRDFVYDLLNFIKPERTVELGSQYGCSLFAFCQSVKDNGLNTQINAVDYWKGDIGAEDTGEEVYEIVKRTIKEFFSDLDINLYQMDFDSALSNFADSSIDILHIDGGHRYEDVEHDMNSWIGKLKENGVILFHDAFSEIDRGSCIHWEKTKKEYPSLYFEFEHSCGLGILFPKGDYWYKRMQDEEFMEKYHHVYYYRSLYRYTKERMQELEGLYQERYVAIENQSKMIDERNTVIENQSRMIDERDAVIESQKLLIDEKDEGIRNQSRMIDERDATIEGQKRLVDEKDEGIRNQSRMIDERDATIESQRKSNDEKDQIISEQIEKIQYLNDLVQKVKKHKIISKLIFH